MFNTKDKKEFLNNLAKEIRPLVRGKRLRMFVWTDDTRPGPHGILKLGIRFPRVEGVLNEVDITPDLVGATLHVQHVHRSSSTRIMSLADQNVFNAIAAWLVEINHDQRRKP